MMQLRVMILLGLLAGAVFSSSESVFAATTQGNTFEVNFSVIDSDPPTTPLNPTSTAVSDTQIDVSWDASSDNVSVDGYQVFRDSTAIATTTLTSFSDTGLTPSTTYTYFVRAFDPSLNYSSSSATTSTSTLDTPPPPVVATSTPEAQNTTATRSGLRTVGLLHLQSTTTERSIALSFNTNVYTQALIRWGRTSDYESGFVTSDIFKRSHKTLITGLESGAVYEIEILVTNRDGSQTVVETLTLSTKEGPDTIPPAAVSDFVLSREGEQVTLKWRNPTDQDFERVRVVSSDVFLPNPQRRWMARIRW